MDELYHSQLRGYLDSLVPERPQELQAMETYAKEHRFPIIGPASGYLCYQIARTIGAKKVFEMGSGYGYSTAWFAKAIEENGGGEVHHVVWDEELSQKARGHLGKLAYGAEIHYTVGEAIQALRETEGPFDIIFNDIDKEAYPESLDVIETKLRPGGVLIIDNMLWHARIFDENDKEASTEAIREFTHRISTSEDWISSVIPIRDGLIVAYRK
ncbi:MAG: O-methyltransferase [Chloroflexi bacterium]|nr:MAG: O-methyltransferase [Chloroflexota bacterium]MBL1196563.1 O-methyltransferase [Chloroflexota bacterium]NOH13858.1 O-methyltransferase [Chloroflexota bacterium]